MHICGLFTVGAKCNRRKNGNNIFPNRGANPGRLRDRPTLYHVAVKAGLYRKVVQVYHTPIPGDMYVHRDRVSGSYGWGWVMVSPVSILRKSISGRHRQGS